MELFSEHEFQKAKFRDLLNFECDFCKKSFNREKRYAFNNRKFGNKNHGCCKKCSGNLASLTLGSSLKQVVSCRTCEKKLLRKQCEIKKTNNSFCSRSCSATYHNSNKKHGTSRSKLEKWLEEQLVKKYPNLIFDFNKTSAINAELDIYIPELKLAFELNGIFHYEPIFGEEKLQKTQNNDQKKFLSCHNAGIGLCVIDSSSQKTFRPKSSQKYLDIITSIIDQKLSEIGAC